MRHGEAENNVAQVISSRVDNPHHLTEKGREQVQTAAKKLREQKIDLIVSSDFVRTKETAEIVAKELDLKPEQIIYDERLREVNHGDLNLRPVQEYWNYYQNTAERFTKNLPHGENFAEIRRRLGAALYDLEQKYRDQKILIITHESPVWLLTSLSGGLDRQATVLLLKGPNVGDQPEAIKLISSAGDFITNAEVRPLNFTPLPHNADFELDLHRPFIDEVVLEKDGVEYKRVPEVMDVWFDSGAMPFASRVAGYPADFISEAIDQTRGWFYTLHAIGVLMGRGKAYQNVICLGHLLDKDGQKMSKSLGNVVDPWLMIAKYGADVLRFWMYSINQPGEAKNFDEKTVQEVVNKIVNLLTNVMKFYQLYAGADDKLQNPNSKNILDQWILARLDQLIGEATTGLDNYNIITPARAIRDFIADLSQWYIRRSRDRFKSDNQVDREMALVTTRNVLLTLAKLLAPFMPFLAEDIYRSLRPEGAPESVHLSDWPQANEKRKTKNEKEILEQMNEVRRVVSLALEARAKARVKVRQPLALLKIKSLLPDEYSALICDELNVKKVVVDKNIETEIWLDTIITSELQTEGDLRDLIRELQEQRKKKGLRQGEEAILDVPAGKKDLLIKRETELKNAVSATGFNFV